MSSTRSPRTSRRLSAAGLVGLEELTATPGQPEGPDGLGVTRVTPELEQLVVSLPLTSIAPNAHQPRRAFDARGLQELADSIAAHGRVLQPIVVRHAKAAGEGEATFELVAGERRWRASAIAGLTSIRAIVDGVDDPTSAQLALAENMARQDLNPMEEGRGCAALRDRFGMSVTAIAKLVGRERTAVSHLIRLLDLPDKAQDLIAAGTLSEGHGRVLLRVEEFGEQAELAERCAASGWSVRELERQVDAFRAQPTSPAALAADQAAALDGLIEQLAPVFGANHVSIVARRHGSYEIHVRCEHFEALTATVEQLASPPGV